MWYNVVVMKLDMSVVRRIARKSVYAPNKVRGKVGNSLRGFRAVLMHEKAFRIDLIVFAVCTVIVSLIPDLSWCARAVMIYAAFVPILAELVNTAVETTVDRISKVYHHLSGRAKDIGSALVCASFIGAGICWFVILLGWSFRTFR